MLKWTDHKEEKLWRCRVPDASDTATAKEMRGGYAVENE